MNTYEDLRLLREAWDAVVPEPIGNVIYVSPKVAQRAAKAGIDLDAFYWREYGAKVVVKDMTIPPGEKA